MIIAIKSPIYNPKMFFNLGVKGLEKYDDTSSLKHNAWIKSEQWDLFNNAYRHNVQLIETYLFFEITEDEDDPDFWSDFDIDWSMSRIVDVGFNYGVELEVWNIDTTVNTEYFDLVQIDLSIKLNLTVRIEEDSTYQKLFDVLWNINYTLIYKVKIDIAVRFENLSESACQKLVNILKLENAKTEKNEDTHNTVVISNLSHSEYQYLLESLWNNNLLGKNNLILRDDVKLNVTMRFENLWESKYKELLDALWDNDLILLDDVHTEDSEDTQNKVVINDDDLRGGVFNEESIGLDRDSLMLLINKYGIFNENEAYETVDKMFDGEFYSPVIPRALADKYYVKELQFMARQISRHEQFNENLLALIETAIELNEDCN